MGMYAFFPSVQQQKEMGRYEKWKLRLALLPELSVNALLLFFPKKFAVHRRDILH
jgi:hypothetical protein